MQRKLITLVFIFSTLTAFSQQVIDFEGQINSVDTFKNGQSGEGDFQIGIFTFPNEYDFQNDYWSGQWAMSSSTNKSVPNFLNLYGCIEGEGYDGSQVYAVAQKPFSGIPLHIKSSSPIVPENVYITNTTYVYNVVKDGNQFAKAFGGPSGDDPDYFYIQWNGYLEGEPQGSESFYLADYRFSNNSQDYIIDQWTQFDLSGLGMVDSIQIEYYSTDTGEFGINTPLFFAIDNFEYQQSSSSGHSMNEELVVYPNPCVDEVKWTNDMILDEVHIIDVYGRSVLSAHNATNVDISQLSGGTYFMEWKSSHRKGLQKIVIK